MKKLLSLILCFCLCFCFYGCEISDTEIANSLEGNMTRLVYSVGYLDAINEEELSALVNGGSTYFTHSNLYAASLNNNASLPNAASGNTSSLVSYNGRNRVYSSMLDEGASTVQSISANSSTAYASGSVSMELIETSSQELNDILLEISQKRGIIMLYCTDLRSGKATLSFEAKEAISEYTDIIKETTAYLNSNAGDLTGHFNALSSIALNENSHELVNARLIRANEVLKTRYAKLDTCLDSMSAIIDILHSSTSFNYVELYNAGVNNYYNGNTINNLDNAGEIINSNLIDEEIEQDTDIAPIAPTNPSLPNENSVNNTITNKPIVNPNGNNCYDNLNDNALSLQENNCCNKLNNSLVNPNASTPLTGKQDNTIINYNMDGNNSSNIAVNNKVPTETINNTATTLPPTVPSTNTTNNENLLNNTKEIFVEEQAQTKPNNPTNIGLNTPSLPLGNNTLIQDNEVALNGGLVRSASYSVIINEEQPSEENTTDGNAIRLNLIEPENKLVKENKEEPVKPLPILDLREEEITESEKELTPDILPLIGEKNEKSPLLEQNTIKELGFKKINPIAYEEENPIMLLPRK